MKELKCPAQDPDPNPTEHLSDELEYQLCAKLPCMTSVPELISALVAE